MISFFQQGWVSEALPIAFGLTSSIVPCLPILIQHQPAISCPVSRI
jgi:hypothetical protein